MVTAIQPSDPRTGRTTRWLKALGDFLFATLAVLIIAAALIYGGMQVFGYRFYEVASSSMAPNINRGDVVAVRSTPAHEIEAGDVILYEREGFAQPILHRVTRIHSDPDMQSIIRDTDGNLIEEHWAYSPRTFWAQGDANPAEDTLPIAQEQVLGIAHFTVPFPFNLVATTVDRSLLFLLAAGSLLLFAAIQLGDIVRMLVQRRHDEPSSTGSG